MSKLLYISVNSKPTELSASKTIAKEFIDRFLKEFDEFELEEIDLYKEHIPRLEYQYFEQRNSIVDATKRGNLNEKDKAEVEKINKLCEQFKSADIYVIAAPMWSLSYPAPLKEYIDCILQDGKTISINNDKVKGLLEDKRRSAIYIQSSGGKIPWLLRMALNKGVNYIEDIFKFMGIKKFTELLVDGTGFTEEERENALNEAREKIDDMIHSVWI